LGRRGTASYARPGLSRACNHRCRWSILTGESGYYKEPDAMKEHEGKLVAPADAAFAVLVSRFNEFITSKLLGGATDALRRHGVADEKVDVIWSPGSFEMPLLAKKLAQTGRYDAVICLGAVIRGGTDHHQYIASEAAKGIAAAAMDTGVPCLFGVLTCDTLEQAVERAGTKAGNKGADAAVSAIEMTNLCRQLNDADAPSS